MLAANAAPASGLQFDGNNDYVTMGAAPGLGSDTFTLETWFQRTGTGQTASTGTGGVIAIPLVAKGRGEGDNSNLDMNYFLGIRGSDGVLVADFEEGAAGSSPGLNHPVIGVTPVTNNVWHHAAVSYDGSKWQLFLDGVLETELVIGLPPRGDSIQHAALGSALNSSGTSSGAFAGILDEVRIWDYARSATQISNNHLVEITAETGLIGRWALDETAGLTAADSAGSSIDGTLTNGPVWTTGYPFLPVPGVTLTAPVNGSTEVGPNVTFTVDATDATGLASATLYVGLEGDPPSFLPVETKVISGTSATVNFTTSLADSQDYKWNCLVTNGGGGQAWASSDFALLVDANFPDAPSLVTPLPGEINISVPPELQVQVTDPNADPMTVSFYGRAGEPADFTIAVIPDTQYYVSSQNGGTPSMFTDQTDWIVANQAANNIVFVSHVGDVVQNGDAVQAEWLDAIDAMYDLEYPSPSLPDGIPYGVAVGNHDQSPFGDPNGTTNFFNQYFGVSVFAGRAYYGGHYGSDNDNSYQLISANGLDLIIINIEYDPAADPAVLAWANGLLQTYSDRVAIVVTHHVVGTGNPAAFSAQGQATYDALKGNANLKLMLGGHVTGEGQRVDTFDGNTVHSLLADYQNLGNGGNGWMRLLEFSPANDEIRVKTYSPTLGQFETDADSEFTLSTVLDPAFELLGTNTNVASGSTTSAIWSDAEVGSGYEWYVSVTDSTGRNTQGSVWTFETEAFDLNPPVLNGIAAINITDQAAEIVWGTDEVASSHVDYGLDAFYGSFASSSAYVASHSVALDNLALGQTYHYRVTSVDRAGNTTVGPDMTFTTAAVDLTPPSPNPMTWASAPASAGIGSIAMTASNASDPSGVEYYFENVTDPAHDSGWQGSSMFTDTLLLPNTSYTYRVKTRDLSAANNESGYSSQLAATTGAGSATVLRGPYLQNGKADGVSIMWRTDNFTDGRVWYGDSPSNLTNVVDEPVPPAPLIDRGANWKYLDDGSDQGTAWRAPSFDDSSWSVGSAELGYGDSDEATVVSFGPSSSNKYTTTYFRHSFNVTGAAGITSLELGLLRDDGAVVYLNGTELRQDNISGNPIAFDTFASSAVGGASEDIFYVTTVDPALLVEGTNVVAVEVHQANLTSSDISFDLDLYLPQPGGGGDGFDHLVRISGLNPNTTYYYQVGTAQDEVLAGADSEHYFKTLPTPGTNQPVRIWALGDSGTADNLARSVRDAYLDLAVAEKPADFLLMLGDNAYTSGTDTEYQNAVFQNMYEDILRNRVLWSTQGNHDLGVYFDVFDLPIAGEAGGVASGTEDYYSFDVANVHLICLSSQDLNLCSNPNSLMYQWLNADLLATQQPWIIAFWHHPAYTKGSHDSDDSGDSDGRMEDMRTIALPILEAGGVDLILSGHSHSYERSKFINGHYGLSGDFDAGTHVIQTGDGDPAGDGAYTKVGDDGAVYITAGSSGKISGVSQHNAMEIWLNNLGSVIIDVDHDQMDVRFLRELTNPTQIDDVFQITKNLGPDLDPPAPDPMTWASVPTAVDDTSITMTATTASDISGVEYLFENLSVPDGSHDSDWQASPTYVDSGLDPGTSYIYRVSARDLSPAQNTTAVSTSEAATTDPDSTPPEPNPPTWAGPPTAVDTTSITMTATTATDVSGVEYLFENLTISGHDSLWQSSPTHLDTGLQPGTMYVYKVTARDLSPAQNTGGGSIALPATTLSDAVTIDQAGAQSDPTAASPINFTVVFAQVVTGFETGDVTLGGTAGAATAIVTGSGTTYNVAVSGMTGAGTVTASVAAGVAIDPAGDGNAASTSTDNEVTYDATAPAVTINQAAGQTDPANAGPINFTVVFDEPVTGFETGDVTLTGPTTGVVTPIDTTTYNVAVTGMTGEGTVIASIDAGVAADAAGNPNVASTSTDNSVNYDLLAPTASSMVRANSTPTNAASVDWTVSFSEAATGVDAGDFALATTGTAAGTITGVTGSGASYTVTASGISGDGTLGLDLVDDDSIVDQAANPLGGTGAGNGNFTGELYTIDQTGPSVAIGSTAGDPTNASPIPLTLTFGEPVTGFVAGDISATGGTLSDFAGADANYTVNLTPSGESLMTVDVAGSVASDAAGNGNSAAAQFTITYDETSPTVVSILRASGNPTSETSLDYTVNFSESVASIDVTDFELTVSGTVSGTVSSVSSASGSSVTVVVSGITGTGTLRLDLLGSATIADAAGNALSGGFTGGEVYDVDQGSAAVLSILRASGDPTSATSVDYAVSFSEAVTGVDAGDFALATTGTAAGTITGVGGSDASYTVTVSGISGDGTLGLDLVDDDSIIDQAANPLGGAGAGNGNFTGALYTIDQTGPSVAIGSTTGDPTNASPIPLTLTFSEPVTGFVAGDIAATGGTLSDFAGADANYTANLTPSGDGLVTVDVVGGVASDAAGNGNSAAAQFATTYDGTAPTVVSILRASGNPTSETSVDYTVAFSEAVTGVDTGDFALATTGTAAGTITGVTGGDASYTLTVSSLAGDGTLGVNLIDDDGIVDAAANPLGGAGAGNGDLTGEVYTVDREAPTVTIDPAAGQVDPTSASPINFTVIFSETVADFVTGDVTLGGTAAAATATVTGSGTTYNVAVSGMTGDGTVIASLEGGVATDAAGNGNTASSQSSITYDATAPVVVSLLRASSTPTSASSVDYVLSLSEPVTGVDAGDFALATTATAAGTISGVVGSGASYTVTVSSLSGDGLLWLNLVDDDTIVDAVANPLGGTGAGNGDFTGELYAIDQTAPSVAIGSTVGDPTNTSPVALTFTFSEPVTGFVVGDVAATGGTLSDFAGAGENYSVNLTPSGDGLVTVDVTGAAVTDAAGNGNSPATQFATTYDGTAPAVTINQGAGQVDPTTSGPINFTVVFDEPVIGFATGDVTLGGTAGATTGTVTEIAPNDGTAYNVAASGMTGDGTVTATVATGMASDAAGNVNTASSSSDNEVTLDATSPGVTINQAAAQDDPTSANSIDFTVVFNEAVSGFQTGDVTLGGTAGATTATVTEIAPNDGTTYNVAAGGMIGAGTVTADLAAGVATDAAGNGNAASGSSDNEVTYSGAQPEVLFTDGFESGNLTAGGWSTQNSSAAAKGSAAFTGAWGAELKKSTWMERSVSTLGYDSIEVSYARQTAALDNGEVLLVEWSTGGAWTLIESTQTTTYGQFTFDLPSGADDNAAFTIRFTTNANRNNEKARIDDVQITGVPTAPPVAPGTATSPSPANAAADVNIGATLSWTAGSGADSHDVYFGPNPTPGAGELQGNQAGTTFDPGTLAYSTTYFWRVDGVNAVGTTAGTIWSFTTQSAPPEQATSPNPTDGASGVNTAGTILSWTAGSGADSHDVYFGTDSTPDAGELIVNQTGSSFDPGTLAAGTAYYWRIDEVNATGTTTGQVWSFTTQLPPPGQASTPNPADTATGVSALTLLSWTAGSNAISHDVYFGTNPTPGAGELQGNQAGTTFDPGVLTFSTTYFWRIDEVNTVGTTTGIVWSFTTQASPPPPGQASAPSPADAATGVSVTGALSWSAGSATDSHDVYFGTNPTPGAGELVSTQTGTSYDPPGNLAYSTTYYWRIDEVNAVGTTAGLVWSLTTQGPPPGQASSPSPADAATDIATTGTTLSWTAGGGAISHDVYFGTSPTPAAGEFQGNQAGTSFDPGALAAGTTYYWRVDEVNATGTTTGIIWSFTTEAPSGPVSLFSDGFESGDFSAGGWSRQNNAANVKGSASLTGAFGAELKKTTWIETSVSTAGYHTIHLKYNRRTTGLDSGELFYAEWWDGTAWAVLEATPNSAWTPQDWTLPPSADNNANLKIRFRIDASANNEKGRLDDVEVTGIPN